MPKNLKTNETQRNQRLTAIRKDKEFKKTLEAGCW
jgi:hypothetical protein